MITVTILTKNSRKYLPKVLDALTLFSEVLILDSGSTDDTLQIANKYSNVVIYQVEPFDGFGTMHNRASSLAKNDWILSVDSDEIVVEELVQEILAIQLDEMCVYSISRHNYYNGKFIRGCGWYPDRQFRLYNRNKTSFSNVQVHESVIIEKMRIVPLKNPIIHYSYATTADFLAKMQSYSDLFAKQNRGKKTSSLCKAVLHASFSFFKSYFLKKGFLDGKEGFIISLYQGNTAFYKYLKLMELNLVD